MGDGADRVSFHLNFVGCAFADVGELQRIVDVPQVHVLVMARAGA
jgi:hypothetical protein